MENKNNFTTRWDEAENFLKKDGLVNITTGGGETWNREVAVRLSEMVGQPVILIGEHPERKGTFQYSINLKSNQDAKILLAKEDIR